MTDFWANDPDRLDEFIDQFKAIEAAIRSIATGQTVAPDLTPAEATKALLDVRGMARVATRASLPFMIRRAYGLPLEDGTLTDRDVQQLACNVLLSYGWLAEDFDRYLPEQMIDAALATFDELDADGAEP